MPNLEGRAAVQVVTEIKRNYEPIQGVTLANVTERIHFNPADTPMLYLAVAPCRSGTTAQLRPFAERGMEAHYQPIKAIYRNLSHGREAEFIIPSASQSPALLVKETIGPYTRRRDTDDPYKVGEANFDPLKVLIDAGYPKEKIRLLVEMREPLPTFTSWMENFTGRISGFAYGDELVDNFVTAVGTVKGIYERASDEGIPTVPFVYEALRGREDTSQISTELMRRLGIPDSFVGNGRPIDDNIIFAHEPPIYEPPKLHALFREESTLVYFPKAEDVSRQKVSQGQAFRLAQTYDFYHMLRRSTEEFLGIEIPVAA